MNLQTFHHVAIIVSQYERSNISIRELLGFSYSAGKLPAGIPKAGNWTCNLGRENWKSFVFPRVRSGLHIRKPVVCGIFPLRRFL